MPGKSEVPLLVTILKSKLHHAEVTDVNLYCEGSVAIDKELMKAASIYEYEQVHIYDVENGERFTTYAIASDVAGEISVRGSAARHVMVGDTLIICTYGQVDDKDLRHYASRGVSLAPTIVRLGDENEIKIDDHYQENGIGG